MGQFAHTPETDQVIRDGYAVNRKVSLIAAELGVSRNTIIGRARRLRLADYSRWLAANGRPEVRAARSEQMKERWRDRDYAQSMITVLANGRDAFLSAPGSRAILSEKQTARWESTEARREHGVKIKAAWQRRKQAIAAAAA